MGELDQIACPEFLWNVHVAVSSWKITFGAKPLLRVVGPITSWFCLLTTGQVCKARRWQPPTAMLSHGIQPINGKAVTSSLRFPSSIFIFLIRSSEGPFNVKSCKSDYQITSVVTRDLQLCFLVHLQTRIWTFELDWERRWIRLVRFLLHGPGPTPQLHLISSLTCHMTCGCPMLLVLQVLHLPPRSRCASMVFLKVRWDCLISLEFDYQSSAWFGWALEEGKKITFPIVFCPHWPTWIKVLVQRDLKSEQQGIFTLQLFRQKFVDLISKRGRYHLEAVQGHCGDLDGPLLRRSHRDHQLQSRSQTVL